MLSSNVPSTPRPRPPAKVRRSPSLNFPLAPPPPYAPRLDMLLDSPLSLPAQIVASPGGAEKSNPDVQEWVHEKSAEEISSLLLKADSLIKSRETELGLTSALCKSLYEDNIALKSKHEALLARLPSSEQVDTGRSSPSPLPSPTPSPRPSPVNSPCHSPHYYTVSLPQTPHDHPRPLTPSPPPRNRHARRPSVTPEELALLADQNAELMSKLEKLEEESEAADNAGKRKLRKLEKEIQGLREELERTRLKGDELEQKANAVLAVHEPEIQRKKKEEREERIRGLREKATANPKSLDAGVKDFAPPPELPRSKGIPESMTSPPPSVNLSTKPQLTLANPSGKGEASKDSYFTHSNASGQLSAPQLEYAIISQLLMKIRELEVTNAQITEGQRVAADKYRSVQRDAENLRKAYDHLTFESGDLRISSQDTSGVKALRSVSGETITFNSSRRTVDGDLSDDGGEFARGIGDNMQSTTRSTLGGPSNPSAIHKARKSVVGLFDSEVPTDRGSTIEMNYAPSVIISSSFRHASPTPPSNLDDASLWSTAATEGLNISSHSVSTLGLSRQIAGDPSVRRHTLESELGSEFGDDWGEGGGNHHLRSTSLYDLTGLVGSSRETSPAPDGSPIEDPAQVFYSPESTHSEMEWEDADVDALSVASITSVAGSAVPQRDRGLGIFVEPSTPRANRVLEASSSALSLDDPRCTRNYRLSQTVRARTNRWVEGRYDNVPSSAVVRRRPTGKHKQRASDASMVFSETFETVVRQMSFTGGFPVETDDENGEADGESTVKVAVHPPIPEETEVVATPSGPRQQGFVGFVLEIWLWLQFVIVVVVFLWAMARRGPKNVLKEAENRRKSVIPGQL